MAADASVAVNVAPTNMKIGPLLLLLRAVGLSHQELHHYRFCARLGSSLQCSDISAIEGGPDAQQAGLRQGWVPRQG